MHRAARRTRRRNLTLAVVTVSGLVVLPLTLWSALGSGGSPAPGPSGTPSRTPGRDAASPGPSWAGRTAPGQGTLHGRLRNLASGLCVGVVGEKAVEGAETELADCSAAPAQQWTYETDGLLRNAAAPDLCLDSGLGYSVRLAPCTATGRAARDIRYDFTLQGVLVPRSDQGLALTPAATDGSGALVLKTRAPGTAQRWSVDTAHPDLRMENVNWDGDSTPVPTATAPPAPPAATATPAASTLSQGWCGGGGGIVPRSGAGSGHTSSTGQGAWSTANRTAGPRLFGPSRDRSPSRASTSSPAPSAAATTSRSTRPDRSSRAHGRPSRSAAASRSEAADVPPSVSSRSPGSVPQPSAGWCPRG